MQQSVCFELDAQAVSEAPSDTLVAALQRHAALRSDAVHVHLIDDDGEVEPISFRSLLAGGRAVAAGLRARGVRRGDTVALMLPTSRDFFVSFTGVLLAGATPVPIYPPVRTDELEDYAGRQVGILSNAEVRALITFPRAEGLALLLRPRIASLASVSTVGRLSAGHADPGDRLPHVMPDDAGLIQYTSGSTGEPKGVVLSHRNLLANVRAIGHQVAVTPDDVVISWLPLYHDMGLIGCWLFALYFRLPIAVLSPLAFLRRPERWLRAVHDFRGTLSPAPNFAYEHCVRKIKDAALDGLDLSSWRVALNGAEPVRPGTLERFASRFGPYGFRPESMLPVYGLAENAVALTFPEPGRTPRIDRVDRPTFERERRAVVAADEPSTPAPEVDAESAEAPATDAGADRVLEFVSVGRPLVGHDVRVVDDAGQPLDERLEGHIEFRGLSQMRGYHRNSAATAAVSTEDGWTRTGDMGYVAEGELFITGRSKDLIIKAGRNIHPQEVEAAAAEVDGVRPGCVAAFSVGNPRTGSEGLVLIVESRDRSEPGRRKLAAAVHRQVGHRVRISPDDVRVVRPRTIPKTPSGKLRRNACRQLYLTDSLDVRRPPAWVQLARLAAGTVWAKLRGVFAASPRAGRERS